MNKTVSVSPSPDGPGEELIRLVPRIVRARGWRLYTADGRRLTDLWQYGGRALLGHKPPGLLRVLKNSGERGLFTPLPHFAEDRLLKALTGLFPGRRFRIYPGGPSPDRAAAPPGDRTADFAGGSAAAGGALPLPGNISPAPRWRPFLDSPGAFRAAVFIPLLPFPFPGAPEILAFDPFRIEGGLFPPPVLLSPAALTAAARCVLDLTAALAGGGRGGGDFSKINRALKGHPHWRREGIYLFYTGQDADYPALFRRFLEGGFLLPPEGEKTALLPGELSPGEEVKLAGLFQAGPAAAV